MGNRIAQNFHGVLQATPCYGYCIPMEATLTRIVTNPAFLSHICHPNVSNDGILRDDIDGSNTRNHPVFQLAPDALRIRLYYDDVTVTDSVGSYQCNLGKSASFTPWPANFS